MFRRHFLEDTAGGTTGGAGAASTGSAGGGTSITAPPAAGGGTPAASAGGSAGGGTAPPAGGNAASWMESLPEDLRADPSIQLFKESGVNGLAKSWVSAQAMLGKDKVVIPGEKSTDEERAAFFAKLGRPESPDKYEFKLPDGQKLDDTFAKGFRETAFTNGLNGKQVQKMVEWYAKEAGGAVQAAEAAKGTALKASLDEYSKTLGGEDKFKARVEQARVAVRALADPKLNAFLDKSGAGSQPEMIEFFARLSGMMSEDKIRDGTGVSFAAGNDPTEIQAQISEIEHRMFSDLNSTHKDEWVSQLSKLYTRLEHARAPRQ